jgi:hypothetical protein
MNEVQEKRGRRDKVDVQWSHVRKLVLLSASLRYSAFHGAAINNLIEKSPYE